MVGYFRPKEGANNFALALIDFESLGAYEKYRKKLAEDEQANAQCILVEDRMFLERA